MPPSAARSLGKRAGGRSMEQLEGAIEIGLAHAIGADIDAQPVEGEADVAQRPVSRRGNGADDQGHGGPI
jgi:hypothetical protein